MAISNKLFEATAQKLWVGSKTVKDAQIPETRFFLSCRCASTDQRQETKSECFLFLCLSHFLEWVWPMCPAERYVTSTRYSDTI